MSGRLRLVAPTLALVALTPAGGLTSTADHSKYEILNQEFKTGPDVTKACLTCHVDASKQLMETIHWTWVCPKAREKGMGKAGHIVNNFCIALPSNEPRCTSCHAGYGWKDKNFDFKDETKVDCLVCHDTTGTYKKFPSGAGHPPYEPTEFQGKMWNPPDLNKVAKSVGEPSRKTCGACHFYGGGGEGVKHADLDSSLFEPSRKLDVHMAKDGLNFDCQACHTTHDHKIAGRCYAVPAAEKSTFSFPVKDHATDSHIYCESCHGNAPHARNQKLNDHLDKVSCQACHIPRAAREKPTKGWWDWSKAGERGPDGKPVVRKNASGQVIYDGMKGEFRWDKDFIPEYYWFNGSMSNTLLPDKIDPSKGPVPLNLPKGDYHDPDARIWPMKVHRGKQPYDPENRTFVIPKLFGKPGTGAYWAEYDWGKAIEVGMKYSDLPYSGKFDFVETEMYWQITHQIAPKEDAVTCQECHTREGGRLAKLQGFYMPGRDKTRWLDTLGWVLASLTFAGVMAHGGLRIAAKNNKPTPPKGSPKTDPPAPSSSSAKESEDAS